MQWLESITLQSCRIYIPGCGTCGLEAMRDLFDKTRWNWPDEHFTVDRPAGMTEIAVVLQPTV